MPPTRPLAERFWAKVLLAGDDECWLWTGSRDASGYGRIGIGAPSRYIELAHRVSWELHFGPISEDKHVLHQCDNPPCVNPRHLFLGDQAANNRDMWSKGRGRITHHRGERVGTAKLTAEQVAEIRGSTDSLRALGERFGVSKTAIHWIRSGRNWKEARTG